MDRFKCWDCEKELGNLRFDDETKEKMIRDAEGFLYVLCKECWEDEDE